MATLKRNHHYVPQFWQKCFMDATGILYAREGSAVKQASPKHLMSADWIYTAFDTNWLASDTIEDSLSKAESAAAVACRSLVTSPSAPVASTQLVLRQFVALQACRHPDILGRGHRRTKDLGAVLVKAHSLTQLEFINAMASFGVDALDAQSMFKQLRTKSHRELEAEFVELESLNPHDHQLPHTDALQAQSQIEALLVTMDLLVLDAAPPVEFVLGDTPLPQSDLRLGFTVPIARTVALRFQPAQNSGSPTCTRRAATSAEVGASNQWQFNNALKTTIGADSALLSAL